MGKDVICAQLYELTIVFELNMYLREKNLTSSVYEKPFEM